MRPATLIIVLLTALVSRAAELKPATAQAFDRYVQSAERTMDSDLHSGRFLHIDKAPNRDDLYHQLRSGAVLIDSVKRNGNIPDGLIHHWVGTAFISGASIAQVLSVVQDYDHLPSYYSPEVMSSRLLSRDGDDFTIFMRLRKKKVVTAILDTDYDVRFYSLDAAHVYSVSHSTRIAEIDNPGERTERALPVGNDHGFLWRINSYWRFAQANDGVIVQCEAISLTRDIPAGLGWLIGPFITKIPQESLKFTLEATRNAVQRSRGAAERTARDLENSRSK
jgi:hypothetical protein